MGRPRSARAHGDVINAAVELIARRGIDATSMDAIAEASGVSKATIYRHWPDKDALCLEVLVHLHGGDARPPAASSGDVRADIIALLENRPLPQHSELQIRIMPHLVAYATRNPVFARAWRERVFEPPRAQLSRLLDRAVSEGHLSPALDTSLAIALLLGPMMYGHMLTRLRSEPPPNLAERVVDAFWTAHAVASGRPSEKVGRERRIGDKKLPPSRTSRTS
jgi:AcrR family transcriptional regulator